MTAGYVPASRFSDSDTAERTGARLARRVALAYRNSVEALTACATQNGSFCHLDKTGPAHAIFRNGSSIAAIAR
jgi:hypothetical protein